MFTFFFSKLDLKIDTYVCFLVIQQQPWAFYESGANTIWHRLLIVNNVDNCYVCLMLTLVWLNTDQELSPCGVMSLRESKHLHPLQVTEDKEGAGVGSYNYCIRNPAPITSYRGRKQGRGGVIQLLYFPTNSIRTWRHCDAMSVICFLYFVEFCPRYLDGFRRN